VAQVQEKAFDYLDAPIKRVAQVDVPAPYSGELERSALPDAQKVVAAVKEIL
jgi:pyruvate dehydrogenase E1 component beta subunit